MSVDRITGGDAMRTIAAVSVPKWGLLELSWSDGPRAAVDVLAVLGAGAFDALRAPALFAQKTVGDGGTALRGPAKLKSAQPGYGPKL